MLLVFGHVDDFGAVAFPSQISSEGHGKPQQYIARSALDVVPLIGRREYTKGVLFQVYVVSLALYQTCSSIWLTLSMIGKYFRVSRW